MAWTREPVLATVQAECALMTVNGSPAMPEPPRHQEIIECDGEVDQGLVFIRVVALPSQSSVEFDTSQARNFAERILKAVEAVEKGWAGRKLT